MMMSGTVAGVEQEGKLQMDSLHIMISHEFHDSWNIQPEDTLITHEPADIS